MVHKVMYKMLQIAKHEYHLKQVRNTGAPETYWMQFMFH